MIKLNLQPIAQKRGIEKVYSLLRKHGFDSDMATQLNQGTVDYLKFEKMELLCKIFLCEPYDFLEWHPEPNDDIEKLPLKVMLPKPEEVQITKIIKELPLDKLNELLNVAKRLKEGE